MAFSVHTVYRSIFKIWRKRRLALFLRLMKPAPSDALLDVGGYPGCWTGQAQPVGQIDSINVHEVRWKPEDAPNHRIRTLVGDGCSLPISDKTYDIGFSNSVIEHVGSWERQQAFAGEIRRVSKAVWVQTPAYECFIEPHYLTPFVHYLPRSVQKRVLRWFSVWGWLERPNQKTINEAVDSTRLLRKSEVKQLFPDCEILTERLLWVIPKSYIAMRLREDATNQSATTREPSRQAGQANVFYT
jgi:hypothetical protein